MPFLFIGSGLLLLFTGLNGNAAGLYKLLAGDFTGPNNYVYWMIAIIVLGGIGYIPAFKNLSRTFIVLVLLVLLLDNKGFFAQLQSFISSNSTATNAAPNTTGSQTQ